MPRYTFICECGFEIDLDSGHLDSVDFFCPECSTVMKKKITVPRSITYGDGLKERREKTHKIYNELKETKKRFSDFVKTMKKGDYKC